MSDKKKLMWWSQNDTHVLLLEINTFLNVCEIFAVIRPCSKLHVGEYFLVLPPLSKQPYDPFSSVDEAKEAAYPIINRDNEYSIEN